MRAGLPAESRRSASFSGVLGKPAVDHVGAVSTDGWETGFAAAHAWRVCGVGVRRGGRPVADSGCLSANGGRDVYPRPSGSSPTKRRSGGAVSRRDGRRADSGNRIVSRAVVGTA